MGVSLSREVENWLSGPGIHTSPSHQLALCKMEDAPWKVTCEAHVV